MGCQIDRVAMLGVRESNLLQVFIDCLRWETFMIVITHSFTGEYSPSWGTGKLHISSTGE